MRPIYLDYHATTPLDPRVLEAMSPFLTSDFGNPSSVDHEFGNLALKAVRGAAQKIAELLLCKEREIVFTSGATESVNLAIRGVGEQNYPHVGKKKRIGLTRLEHKAVLNTCLYLEKVGVVELVWLDTDSCGRLDLEEIHSHCVNGLDLLCVMAANNEIGTIYPISEIGGIAKQFAVPYLCDASQAVGKVPIDFADSGITLLAFSGHKLYGPKGIGALVVRSDYHIPPLLHGGGQQNNLRSGTLNVPGIVGLGEACHLRQLEMVADEREVARRRDLLEQFLLSNIRGTVILGDKVNRLAGNLNFSVPGIPNKALAARVRHRLALSTGSACSTGVEEPSHVLLALGLSEEILEGAIRLGLGKFTTDEEIVEAGNVLKCTVEEIRLALAR